MIHTVRGRASTVAVAVSLAACATTPPPAQPPAQRRLTIASLGETVAVLECDGSHASLSKVSFRGASAGQPSGLEVCPSVVTRGAGGIVLLDGKGVGVSAAESSSIVAWAGERRLLRQADGSLVLTTGDSQTALGSSPGLERFTMRGEVIAAIRRTSSGDSLVVLSSQGEKTLFTAGAIDSFDLSPDGKEAVVSAKRVDHHDVAIVSTADGTSRWFGEEPFDETDVTWAPRGNKVSYYIHLPSGVLMRTVHLPTAAQLTIDLGPVAASAPVWDDRAERVAFVTESPLRDPMVESVRYGGEERLVIHPAETRVDADLDYAGGSGWFVQPSGLQPDEKRPLSVWIVNEDVFGWNAVRADQIRGGTGVAVTTAQNAAGGSPFWSAILSLPWVDQSRIAVVVTDGAGGAKAPDGVLVVRRDGDGIAASRNGVTRTSRIRSSFDRDAAELIGRDFGDRDGRR